jgi:hypothetical protein
LSFRPKCRNLGTPWVTFGFAPKADLGESQDGIRAILLVSEGLRYRPPRFLDCTRNDKRKVGMTKERVRRKMKFGRSGGESTCKGKRQPKRVRAQGLNLTPTPAISKRIPFNVQRCFVPFMGKRFLPAHPFQDGDNVVEEELADVFLGRKTGQQHHHCAGGRIFSHRYF